MNIAIIGRSELLYDSALCLIEEGMKVKLVVTAKEAPEYERKRKDFLNLAESGGARFLQTARINQKKNIDIIKQCGRIDIGVSVNYPGIISQEVIDLFRLGILNSHGGDLPRYRGNACQAWAILNREKHIGLCVHRMTGGELDSGDIVARDYCYIDINTRVGQVYGWIRKNTPNLFLEAVKHLSENENYYLEKQSRRAEDILRCYPRRPEDGRIDWNRSNEDILLLINASSEPYAGAFCDFDGEPFIIWRAELHEDRENYFAVPGQVCQIERVDNGAGDVVAVTGKNKLKITEAGYRGKRGKPGLFIKNIRSRLK
ncbi:MAG: formyl transferase [bacterium]|nr:formyl transferase [bacterium]